MYPIRPPDNGRTPARLGDVALGLAGLVGGATQLISGVAVHDRIKPGVQRLPLGLVARELVEDTAEQPAGGSLDFVVAEPEPDSREHTLRNAPPQLRHRLRFDGEALGDQVRDIGVLVRPAKKLHALNEAQVAGFMT